METQAVANLHPDGSVSLLGRVDNVINSGGIKLQAEAIEARLHAATGLELALCALPHPQLGECAALLWAGEASQAARLQEAIADLPPYERPKKCVQISAPPRTANGKIARAACRELLLQTQAD